MGRKSFQKAFQSFPISRTGLMSKSFKLYFAAKVLQQICPHVIYEEVLGPNVVAWTDKDEESSLQAVDLAECSSVRALSKADQFGWLLHLTANLNRRLQDIGNDLANPLAPGAVEHGLCEFVKYVKLVFNKDPTTLPEWMLRVLRQY